MAVRIVISIAVAYRLGFMLSPPDIVSQLTAGISVAILCAVLLLALSRFAFVKSASGSVHTLICVLVCMVAVLSFQCLILARAVASERQSIMDYAEPLSHAHSEIVVGVPGGER